MVSCTIQAVVPRLSQELEEVRSRRVTVPEPEVVQRQGEEEEVG